MNIENEPVGNVPPIHLEPLSSITPLASKLKMLPIPHPEQPRLLNLLPQDEQTECTFEELAPLLEHKVTLSLRAPEMMNEPPLHIAGDHQVNPELDKKLKDTVFVENIVPPNIPSPGRPFASAKDVYVGIKSRVASCSSSQLPTPRKRPGSPPDIRSVKKLKCESGTGLSSFEHARSPPQTPIAESKSTPPEESESGQGTQRTQSDISLKAAPSSGSRFMEFLLECTDPQSDFLHRENGSDSLLLTPEALERGLDALGGLESLTVLREWLPREMGSPKPNPVDMIDHFVALLTRGLRELPTVQFERALNLDFSNDALMSQHEATISAAQDLVRSSLILIRLRVLGGTREVLSSDHLRETLQRMKGMIESVLVPLTQTVEGGRTSRRKFRSPSGVRLGRICGKLCKLTSDFMDGVGALIRSGGRLIELDKDDELKLKSPGLSEGIIISSIFLGIQSFCLGEPQAQFLQEGAWLYLRSRAMALLCTIFAHRRDHRAWIVEEILQHWIRSLPDGSHGPANLSRRIYGRYGLVSGGSISLVSALLLQLVQSTGSDFFLPCVKDKDADRTDAIKSSRVVERVRVLLQHIFTTILNEINKVGNRKRGEKDSRPMLVFRTFIEDLHSLLNRPDWPIAELGLLVLIRCAMAQTGVQKGKAMLPIEIRGVVLDTVAFAAGKLNEAKDFMSRIPRKENLRDPKRHRIVLASDHARILFDLMADHCHDPQMRQALLFRYCFLHAQNEDPEQSSKSLRRHLSPVLSHFADSILPKLLTHTEDVESGISGKGDLSWQRRLDNEKPEQRQMTVAAAIVGCLGPLFRSFAVMAARAVEACEKEDSLILRSKAVKVLAKIPQVVAEPKILAILFANAEHASAKVREKALETLGTFYGWCEDHETANPMKSEILAVFTRRLADSSTVVRKRAVRIVADLCEEKGVIDGRMLSHMLLRTADDDVAIQETVLGVFRQVFTGNSEQIPGVKEIDKRLAVLVDLSAASQGDKPDSIERTIFKLQTSSNNLLLRKACKYLADRVVARVVETAGEQNRNLLKLLMSLTRPYPTNLIEHTELLIEVLRRTTQPQEQLYLMRIITSVLKEAPLVSEDLARCLEAVLTLLLARGAFEVYQEVIPCLCVLTRYHSKKYEKVALIWKACIVSVRSFIQRSWHEVTEAQRSTLIRYVAIMGQLTRHATLAENWGHVGGVLQEAGINSYPELVESSFSLLEFCAGLSDAAVQRTAVSALAQSFRAFPSYMGRESLRKLFRNGISSGDATVRFHFIEILGKAVLRSDVNASFTDPEPAEESGDDAWGTGNGSPCSAYSASFAQACFPALVQQALNCHSTSVCQLALEICGYLGEKGLVHPSQCTTLLMAIESSPVIEMRRRAERYHSVLHMKFPKVVYVKLRESIREVFAYQARLRATGTVKTISGMFESKDSVLRAPYSLVREKRPRRNEFLSVVLSFLDIDTRQGHLGLVFRRFVAEAVSALPFKIEEEVLHAIWVCNRILSTTGSWVSSSESATNDKARGENATAMAIVLILRNFMKLAYRIKDDKMTTYSADLASFKQFGRPLVRPVSSISWDSFHEVVSGKCTADSYDKFVSMFDIEEAIVGDDVHSMGEEAEQEEE